MLTTCAQLTTMPIIVYQFQMLSVEMLLSNVLVLPAQQRVMLWGALATIDRVAWLPLERGRPGLVGEWFALLGDHQVALDHLEGRAAQKHLEAVDVAAVAQEGDGKGVAKAMGMVRQKTRIP